MKVTRDTVGIREEGELKILGEFDFSEFENVAECVEKFGEEITLSLINRSWLSAIQTLARDNCKKTGEGAKSAAEIQTLINDYKPGTRSGGKFNMKSFSELMMHFGALGATETLQAMQTIYQTEGPEAAYNFLKENKRVAA
jgi:hypothetical protein